MMVTLHVAANIREQGMSLEEMAGLAFARDLAGLGIAAETSTCLPNLERFLVRSVHQEEISRSPEMY
jgi:hypothetical protein